MKIRSLLAALIFATAHAQVTLVGHTFATNSSNGTAALNTMGANTILVWESGPYGAFPPADSVTTNKYQLIASQPNLFGWPEYLYMATNITPSVSETWSVNGGGYPATVMALSGVTGLDKVAGASLTYPLPLTLTPTNANEFIAASVQPQSTVTGMTLLDSAGSTGGMSDAYVNQTGLTPAPVSVAWTEPGGAQSPNVGIIAAFYSTASPAPLVSTPVLPEGSVGTPYSYPIPIGGGAGPFTVTSTPLPAGLSIVGSTIAGTPTAVGSASVALTIKDSQGHIVPTPSQPLVIAAQPLAFAGSIACPSGTQYQVYAGCAIAATGGTGPYTFAYAGQTPWTGQQPPANGSYAGLVEGLTLNPATGAIGGTVKGQGFYLTLMVITDAAGASVMQAVPFNIAGENTMAGCSYPADAIYYQDISKLPVDTSVAAPIYSGYLGATIKAGFGQYGNGPDGIPFYKVGPNQPMVAVNTGLGTFPGGMGPIPFDAPMEGTRNAPGNVSPIGNQSPADNYTSDNHVLILQTGATPNTCKEWSLYNIYPNYPNTNSEWGSGILDGQGGYSDYYADMTSYALTPQGQPGADAGGLPIIPLLENADEVIGTGTPSAPNGVVAEMKRFTVEHTLRGYVWPATHQAGYGGCSGGFVDATGNGLLSQLDPPTTCSAGQPTGPVGEIYRLKASVAPACDASSPQGRIIEQGLRIHGAILADNGQSGALIGTPDTRWNMADLACLNNLTLADFEPVLVQPLAVSWPTSSQITTGAVVTPPVGPTTVTVQVTATSADGQTKTQPLSLVVNPAVVVPVVPVSITNGILPGATVGQPYSATLTAAGGTPPYTWSIAGFPADGLTLANGVISGVIPAPTFGNNLTLIVTVTDSKGATTTANLNIQVTPATLTVTLPALPAATVGVPYTSPPMVASGGAAPIVWSATGLPSGLTMNPATGVISGTP